MIILKDIIQGSDGWYAEKAGKPSASNCSKIITNDCKPSKQAEGYAFELAAERITGRAENGYKNAAMEAGQEREDEARKLFQVMYNVDVEQVGVVYKDEKKQILCSPDGLCKNYGLELKNPLAKTQAKYLYEGGLPSEYYGQCQFSLYVTGFKKWMFLSYVPLMKPLIIEVKPDEKFQKALAVELEVFVKRLDEITAKLKG